MKPVLLLFVAACVALLTLAACGGSGPPAPSRCLDVPTQLVEDIAQGLTVQGGGSLRAESAQAVKSNDYEKVFFIAVDIQGQGMEGTGEIGVWASNSLESGKGLILSAEAVAVEFSDWKRGSETDAGISSTDDGVQEAKDCVGARLK